MALAGSASLHVAYRQSDVGDGTTRPDLLGQGRHPLSLYPPFGATPGSAGSYEVTTVRRHIGRPASCGVPLEAVSRVYGPNGNSVVAMNAVTLKVPARGFAAALMVPQVLSTINATFAAEERPKKCGRLCHKCPARFVNQLRAVPRTVPT
jgi:hypothetical protein